MLGRMRSPTPTDHLSQLKTIATIATLTSPLVTPKALSALTSALAQWSLYSFPSELLQTNTELTDENLLILGEEDVMTWSEKPHHTPLLSTLHYFIIPTRFLPIAILLVFTYFIKKQITHLHLIRNNFPDHTWPPYPLKQRRQYHTRKSRTSTGRKQSTSYSTSPTYLTPRQQDCGSLSLLHPLHTSGASYRQQLQPFQQHFKRKRTSYKLLNTLQQIITTDSALCTTNTASCTYSNKPQFSTNTTSRCNNAILKSHSLTHSLTAFQANILVLTETFSHTPICTQNSLFLSMYKKRNQRRKRNKA
jgi:hypothetical protein